MGVETANIVLVVIIVIVFFMLLSACCRQLRNAYEDELTIEELNRRRQAFMFGDDPSNGDEETASHSSRQVRVTAIQAGGVGGMGGDRIFGVYEIRLPRRGFFSRAVAPPPPFNTALQNSSPIYYIDPEEPPPSYDDYLKISTEPEIQAQMPREVQIVTEIVPQNRTETATNTTIISTGDNKF